MLEKYLKDADYTYAVGQMVFISDKKQSLLWENTTDTKKSSKIIEKSLLNREKLGENGIAWGFYLVCDEINLFTR